MGSTEKSQEYLINTATKGKKNTPRESALISREKGKLKESIDPKLAVRAEYLKTIRTILREENYSGKDVITATPDKDDITVIYIKSPQAKIIIDLTYNDEYESTDSLRNNKRYYPEVQITAEIGKEEYSIICETIEDAAKISGELLKQIERIKNPKAFGYKEIGFILGKDREIFLVGRKLSGEGKRLSFLENLNLEDRLTLFSYLSHYFGKKIDPKLLEEPEDENEDEEEKNQRRWRKESELYASVA